MIMKVGVYIYITISALEAQSRIPAAHFVCQTLSDLPDSARPVMT